MLLVFKKKIGGNRAFLRDKKASIWRKTPYVALYFNGNDNGNGIYIPHQIYIHIQMRFTLLQYKGEIGHQHI